MVYSRSRIGTRSLIKTAVLCAFSLSVAHADGSVDASSSTAADVCGISDGDKSVGIRVLDDTSCASGGLGCYNDHCRFCKILETPQSSSFENCTTFGVEFPTMAPLVPSSGTCEVSSGDAAVGISAITDTSCLYGGLGCFNDHCRFCKLTATVQSEAFVNCTDYNSTAGSSTDAPADTATSASSTTVDTDGCTLVPAAGDVEVGISIGADPTCSAGGLGCINGVCRFCRIRTTTKSASYPDCALLGTSAAGSGTDAPTDTPTATPAATTETPATTTETPATTTETPATTTEAPAATTPDATSEAPTATVETPAATTETPSVTSEAPVPTTDVPASTTAAPVAETTCTITASVGDAAVGIDIATDATCSAGGVGCINEVCRFCKVMTSIQSAAFLDCAQFATDASASEVPVADNSDLSDEDDFSTDDSDFMDASDADTDAETPAVSTDAPSETPAATTAAPDTETPAATTAAPDTETPTATTATPDATSEAPTAAVETPAVTTAVPGTATEAPAQPACTQVVSEGDASVGINIVSDISCSAGGIGCIDDVCRFCKVTNTDQSAAFVDCSSIAGAATTTEAPTETPTEAPTETPTEAPTEVPVDVVTEAPTAAPTGATCTQTVSEGDASVGIDIVTDASCSAGGVGCIDDICRFCRVTSTDQSAAFVDCTSIAGAVAADALTENVEPQAQNTVMTMSSADQTESVEVLSLPQIGGVIVGCVGAVAAVAAVARAAKSSSADSNPIESADGNDDDEVDDAESGQRVSPGPVPTEEPVESAEA
jgi:hypothetical protein